MQRSVNEGFSGGEKKRNEILQMALLEPTLAVLDETDSGLDIDALRIVAGGVNALRGPERAMLVITHYQRLLDYIVPDFVHVLADGRIVRAAARSWRSSSRRRATAGSRRSRAGERAPTTARDRFVAACAAASAEARRGEPACARARCAREALAAFADAGLPTHAPGGVALHEPGAARAHAVRSSPRLRADRRAPRSRRSRRRSSRAALFVFVERPLRARALSTPGVPGGARATLAAAARATAPARSRAARLAGRSKQHPLRRAQHRALRDDGAWLERAARRRGSSSRSTSSSCRAGGAAPRVTSSARRGRGRSRAAARRSCRTT